MQSWLNKWIFGEVSASTLAIIRIGFGIVMLESVSYWEPYFLGDLQESKFFFTYDGFHWVKLAPVWAMELLFNALYVAILAFILGFYYRIAAIVLFLSYTYLFLIDKGHYNNHYYLYCMLTFFFALTSPHSTGSVDAKLRGWKQKMVPYWQVWLFRIQIVIVYFYGGIAKLHGDWLQGFPMRFWLYDRSTSYPDFYGDFLRTETAALFYSWGGLAFDLTVGFLLLSRRTRALVLIPVIFFHISNHFFWNIGTFPWTMIIITAIFFEPDFGERALKFFREKPLEKIRTTFRNSFFKKVFATFNPFQQKYAAVILPRQGNLNPRIKFIVAGLVLWFTVQSAVPLRRYLYGGHPSWTGEGHLFAWRMMLVDTQDALKIRVRIPDTGEVFHVAFEQYMSTGQFRKMRRTPWSIIRFIHFIRDEIREKGGVTNPEISLIAFKSVNERIPVLMMDSTRNYAQVPYEPWTHGDFFTDWNEEMEPVHFDLDKFHHWRGFVEEYGPQEQ